MRNKGRIVYSILCFLLFFLLPLSDSIKVYAATWGSVELTGESAVLMDADTGAILFSKNGEEKGYPAIITKVLTALVVLDHCNLDEKVTFSHDAVYNVDAGSSNAQIEAGDVLTVNDCLHALLLKSANESANALAEHVAGSREAFAEMMNDKAKELGCTGSHFDNPSGLFSENHYTTAKDMALIAVAAFHNEKFLDIEKNLRHTLNGLQRLPEGNTIYMEHKMMLPDSRFYDKRVVAGKTGFTKNSGNTLLTLAKEGDRRLVTVVLGDKTPYHYIDTKALLDLGFLETEQQELEDSANYLERIRLEAVKQGYITAEDKLHFSGKVLLSLPKEASQEGLEFQFLLPKTEETEDTSADDMTANEESPTTGADASVSSGSSIRRLKEKSLPELVFLLDGRMVGKASLYKEQNIRVMFEEASPKTKAAFFAVTISGVTVIIAILAFLFGGGALYGAKNIVDERKRRKKWKERRKKRLEEMKISEEEFRKLMEERKKRKKH